MKTKPGRIRRAARAAWEALNDDRQSAVMALVLVGAGVKMLREGVDRGFRRLDEVESVARGTATEVFKLEQALGRAGFVLTVADDGDYEVVAPAAGGEESGDPQG